MKIDQTEKNFSTGLKKQKLDSALMCYRRLFMFSPGMLLELEIMATCA
jgi:hypothetical protein